jgi:hypothetical protein
VNISRYGELKSQIIQRGFADEIEWSENLRPCDDAETFFREYLWVVLNSGMKNQVARIIERRIYDAWDRGDTTTSAFGHKGKTAGIDYVRENMDRLFEEYRVAKDQTEFLVTLPWIGNITKYHLAKNLGVDCCKPDRHLARIASSYNTIPDLLCRTLSQATGDRVATVDLVIWRAANLGLV